MNRTFVRSTLDDDHKKSAYKITCRSCGKVDKIAVGSHSNSLPPEVSAKKFRQRGWAVGNRVTDDQCPDCLRAMLRVKPKNKMAEALSTITFDEKPIVFPEVIDMPAIDPRAAQPGEIRFVDAVRAGWASQTSMHKHRQMGLLPIRNVGPNIAFIKESDLKKVFGEKPPGIRPKGKHVFKTPLKIEIETEKAQEPVMNFDPKLPPQMTKEDRRIIFSEIDTHYLDETRGYNKDWNDERVAKSLNVPLAWVRTIREDNFGPEKDESVDAEVEKLRAAIAEAQKLKAEVDSLMTQTLKAIADFRFVFDTAKAKSDTFNELINSSMDAIKKFNK